MDKALIRRAVPSIPSPATAMGQARAGRQMNLFDMTRDDWILFGLVIVAMAYSIGNISGCHINPAVSIAMLISGKMSFTDFVGYVIAQFAGAIAGAAALR